MLSLHTLPARKGKKKKRVGRGNASKGNYAGRGMKGQRSRSGGKGGLKLRGLKQSMMAVPKKKGFSSPNKRGDVVNVKQLEAAFDADATVTPADMLAKGLVSTINRPVKVLGRGKISKKLTIHAQSASKTAIESITGAGGSFEVVGLPKREKQAKKAVPAQEAK